LAFHSLVLTPLQLPYSVVFFFYDLFPPSNYESRQAIVELRQILHVQLSFVKLGEVVEYFFRTNDRLIIMLRDLAQRFYIFAFENIVMFSLENVKEA
jgi:hypothetical protein